MALYGRLLHMEVYGSGIHTLVANFRSQMVQKGW